ncbi:hypothetical protein GCM10014719_58980 [Planomonospora parontospora subsp. antibiotica]|nr:methyltransferase domain-containing protein [Planomonospora parontospora]GGL49964.1 hypothetical protein GCM10014719_58980 [Planomonospora parontospora subsp. antibiotica]GII19334.1 hypothetical protein Ppa05_60600 [Planomonospora parontospora subsp. antibiotica]
MDLATPPEPLHGRLVDALLQRGSISTAPVAAAMRTIPRHRFLPGVGLEDAYANQVVISRRDACGAALSSASQPSTVAMMLEQLAPVPGQRILEICAGTGYNAALLAELAGPAGQVTTIDIDPQRAAEARERLTAIGYDTVAVLTGDGALGAADQAPSTGSRSPQEPGTFPHRGGSSWPRAAPWLCRCAGAERLARSLSTIAEDAWPVQRRTCADSSRCRPGTGNTACSSPQRKMSPSSMTLRASTPRAWTVCWTGRRRRSGGGVDQVSRKGANRRSEATTGL